jgi:DNA-directed RNA polymerase specialized sigma24 family protein
MSHSIDRTPHGDCSVGTRADALKLASRAATPAASASTAFAHTKSLYAAIMPVRKRRGGQPTTALAERVATIADVDVDAIAALNAVPLNQPLDPRAAALIARAAGPLIPTVRCVSVAAKSVLAEAYGTQDAAAGRICTGKERDNFRTRVSSALLLEAAELLADRDSLITDEIGLTGALQDAAISAMADPTNERWGTSWLATRRRLPGTPAPTIGMSTSERWVWARHSRDIRPELVNRARSFTGGDRFAAEDLVQDTLEKMFQQGALSDATAFRIRALMLLRNANADRVQRSITRDHVEQSVDWSERSGDGTGYSYEERTFGAASREWSGAAEARDGELDARAELDERLGRLASAEQTDAQRAVAREIARIALEAQRRTDEAEAVTERSALLRHLTRAALAAGAHSDAAARRTVTGVLDRLAGRD